MAVSLKKKPLCREYTPVHLMDEEESIQRHGEQLTSLPCETNNSLYIEPVSCGRLRTFTRRALKFGLWFGIIGFFVISILIIPFLTDMMEEVAFDLSAVETSAEIVSIGTANNKELQGVTVMFTDIYGNEQRSKILIDKSENIKIGDIISIRYDPDHTEKVSVGKPIIGILDVKNLQ